MIKLYGFKYGLVGEVLRRIERLGFTFERLELRQASSKYLAKHDEALVINLFILDLKLT
ncbi:TPA: hypothetical protein ACQNWS_000788 [Streptococcus pyogenes]|uniref:Nucleoside-diphosphate kinase n=2 Tax=Streptococcus pyogenes TaxID=1314 RepID=A0A5S4TGD3_STRPY|nr:nucleoside-diphosphate kinase [Streptococcus pyogenes]AIG50206.1 nucleoside diphosphate kinase [Streptococcus pyogenes STAB901]EQL78517.1 hypothetical protein HMPREF1225_0598 [Streptococcus pyogenes UTSW-2]ERL10954.1 hypothetical protein HMPREF1231_1885 [Streptococcus pyogenes GA06023]ESA55557.1 hypothetical protein HMPREF1238_0852 [Streptococcus pyogenes GA40377]KGE60396.1 hypothetical protein MGAS2111_0802 [Streptococcus pyogenes MGAS2111]